MLRVALANFFLHRYPGIVTDFLPQPREGVEQRGLAAVRIAHQGVNRRAVGSRGALFTERRDVRGQNHREKLPLAWYRFAIIWRQLLSEPRWARLPPE